MVIKSQVNEVLNKKMDRQKFLKHIAVGVVAVSGAGAALRLLAPRQKPSVSSGYGSSAYGGTKEIS